MSPSGYSFRMDREPLEKLLRARPFSPFEVQLSSGEVHPVTNPEFAILMRSKLLIVDPKTEDSVYCSLLHITRVRMLEAV